MEKLIPHIENLLIENDYVIVPGLGGFILQRHSAKITSTGIIPPFSTVGFNVRMNNNDGLLATEILRSENISYREACKQIETEIEQAKNELREGKKISIGKFGHLYLNEEQRTAFVASKEYGFIPANFGLKTLHIAKRDENTNRKVTITLPSKNVFRYAATILILFGLFFISPKIGDGEISNQAGINNPLALFKTVVLKEEQPEIIVSQIEQEDVKKYHVVIACLSNTKSAQLYCELLRAKYYDNAHILPAEKTNRIVLESFSDKEIAVLYMKKIRKISEEFKDAWVYHEAAEN